MGKMVKEVKNNKQSVSINRVTNFMGGGSFTISPLENLKMISASSIFGEPSYYRNGEFAKKTLNLSKTVNDGIFNSNKLVKNDLVFSKDLYGKKTSEIMEEAIDSSLDFDFKGTLEWAVELRTKEYNMRLNPQIIMVRAAAHPKRQEFTKLNPGLFNKINLQVMSRLDEPATQLTYWLYKNKTKNSLPTILKKGWAIKFEKAKKYHIAKYKNSGIGIIDTVRVCHAKSENNPALDELLKTGTVIVNDSETTWENLKSQGKDWKYILSVIDLPHMALLRNLKNIFSQLTKDDSKLADEVLNKLKNGVLYGKQLPFRYYTAKRIIESQSIIFQAKILDALEECMDIAINNTPKLSGKTMCLSDNSGSAWGTFNSEYGSVTVADIANLSSVMTAKNSDEGYVGTFGDKLEVIPIIKRNGILSEHEKVTRKGQTVGRGTENGIWLFFDNAINKKEHWDNIFIYSDMQAGHGELYGTDSCAAKYRKKYGVNTSDYIDVIKLIDKYRNTVNSKVNIFCVQVAGYDNVLVPESLYRTSILYGWSGKESLYANKINKLWDEIESKEIIL